MSIFVPSEILELILSYLPFRYLIKFSMTSKSNQLQADDPLLWEGVLKNEFKKNLTEKSWNDAKERVKDLVLTKSVEHIEDLPKIYEKYPDLRVLKIQDDGENFYQRIENFCQDQDENFYQRIERNENFCQDDENFFHPQIDEKYILEYISTIEKMKKLEKLFLLSTIFMRRWDLDMDMLPNLKVVGIDCICWNFMAILSSLEHSNVETVWIDTRIDSIRLRESCQNDRDIRFLSFVQNDDYGDNIFKFPDHLFEIIRYVPKLKKFYIGMYEDFHYGLDDIEDVAEVIAKYIKYSGDDDICEAKSEYNGTKDCVIVQYMGKTVEIYVRSLYDML
uniref:F-box-like protein n=1 Tax=Mimivirus LCMiAC02 TaxID=2506609 RepID=A0A481Z3R9_9VIRU|nr:MAG: F-box-like protein [Mimivirus LCMiAC02]